MIRYIVTSHPGEPRTTGHLPRLPSLIQLSKRGLVHQLNHKAAFMVGPGQNNKQNPNNSD